MYIYNKVYRTICRTLVLLCTALPLVAGLASCSESDDTWDAHHDWQARNAEWFRAVADTARTSMAQARKQYGADWEKHCDWRMYKSLWKAQDYNSGRVEDSIVVRIANHGTGTITATWSDTVRVNFRGWLMPTMDRLYDTNNVLKDSLVQEVFSQSYYGVFNPQTASPSLMPVSSTVEGYSTALQYMVDGDDWYVYIPQQLAYGSTAKGTIPAYSTLLFRINVVKVYPSGSSVPEWKIKPRK